ncbi:MAG: ATP-dependent DNA helicase RecG [Thermodesulfobacteriota bacterium]|nr:ATP-dependent DNA helicase RecG [Thermodesulfobacteriota bacterium]
MPTQETHDANIHAPLSTLKGVGSRLSQKLTRLNLHTIEDILYFLPHRYEDRRQLKKIAQLQLHETAIFKGVILSADEVHLGRSKKRIFEVMVSDDSGQILLKWFHYRRDWMKRRYQLGQQVFVVGELKLFSAQREILHPDIEFCQDAELPAEQQRILPVYPLTEGLSQKQMRKFAQEAVSRYALLVQTYIPADILHKHHFLSISDALLQIHCPAQNSDFDQLQAGQGAARQTLVYDEFFYLQLGLALRRQGTQLLQGTAFSVSHLYTKPLVAMLPFRLTDAQRRVLGEIKRDMMSPHPMNRLIQGDVGSGKTIVALLASLIAIENRAQAAVVAPTEILAEQHYHQFHQWMTALGLRVALLTGSTPKCERLKILAQLNDGSLHLLVGTHAVLQPDVIFHNLGLGIIDEQHRFGVHQRNDLRKKGDHPDVLVMTATPIPRTLSMTVYGDLSLSVIDQLPPGRIPIKTRMVSDAKRPAMIQFVQRELDKGHQAYVVYPLVEESEHSDLTAATDALETLQQELGQHYSLGLLHGRLHQRDKEAIMQQFKEKQLELLVATTVIEVGIDVPNATLMVIEHAERFGLAQLHQLRGRVGRGKAQSYCILVRSEHCSQDGLQRLQVMQNSNDGFQIAEADLHQRGPGEFLGTKQAGLTDFRIANLLHDAHLLELARQDAFALAEQPDFISANRYAMLRQTLTQRWGERLDLAHVG